MSDPLDNVRKLKKRAKSQRKRGKYESALSFLKQAIESAQREFDLQNTDLEKKPFAFEVGDCHGIEGGIYRRWALDEKERLTDLGESESARRKHNELMIKSIKAYDEGFKYESTYGNVNSYNMVNRLVNRLFYNPTWLATVPTDIPQVIKLVVDEQGVKVEVAVKDELEKAKDALRQQISVTGERRADIWALADQALVTLLLGEEDDDPALAYADFIAASPPDYAYDTVISALEPLSELKLAISKNSASVNVSHNLKKPLRELKARLEKRKK
jgi:tetratricopeptide (TPR) repeat protein